MTSTASDDSGGTQAPELLITGAGSIGSLTAERALTEGYAVTLVDIKPPERIPDGVDFVYADVTDFDALSAIIETKHITHVMHTAAMLSTAIRRNPLLGYTVNTIGTANVLEAARQHGVSRVVLASSTTVEYAIFRTHTGECIDEDFSSLSISDRPHSIYVAAKIANEQLGMLYHDLYGVDVVVLRYDAVINPRPVETPTSVPDRLLTTLVKAGQSGTTAQLDDEILVWKGREEFLDVRDCASANLAALSATSPTQRIYNVASGEWHTLDEFIAAVTKAFPDLTVSINAVADAGFAGFPYVRPARSATEAATRELGFIAEHDLNSTVEAFMTS